MSDFEHERLDVYRASIEYLGTADEVAAKLPRGRSYLADQLRRAATSIPLNIAEGSGKFSRDAARFYTIARASALECAAILDALEAMGVFDEAALRRGRELLERIVSMLTGLIRP